MSVTVEVHPIVLLSIVDHYNRLASNTNKRVVGALLGERVGDRIEVTNCYAVPYDEDPEDTSVWFLDDLFHRDMLHLFHRVSTKEAFVGWYSTGGALLAHDMRIHQVFQQDAADPVYLLVDVQADSPFLPLSAYRQATVDGESAFSHLKYSIGYLEAEAIGVDHLLRDILQTRDLPMRDHVASKTAALGAFKGCMEQVVAYLDDVCAGRLPPNQRINMLLQDIFASMPVASGGLTAAVNERVNDFYLSLFVSSLIRAVTAGHRLIDNIAAFKEGRITEARDTLDDQLDQVAEEMELEVPIEGRTKESA